MRLFPCHRLFRCRLSCQPSVDNGELTLQEGKRVILWNKNCVDYEIHQPPTHLNWMSGEELV